MVKRVTVHSQPDCEWQKESLEFVRNPGFKIIKARSVFLGVFRGVAAEAAKIWEGKCLRL
jgi:hypothetical protein